MLGLAPERVSAESEPDPDGLAASDAAAQRIRRTAWIETAILTLLVPSLGWLWDARDPFLVQAHFPWMALAPLLVGLHNGFACAMASSLALLVGAFACFRLGDAQLHAMSLGHAMSVGLLGPLAGEYRDTWQRTLHTLRSVHTERGLQLDRLARAHHLLRRSHDELEQHLASGGPSLQTTLDRVQAQLQRANAQDPGAIASSILQIFSHHGQAQVAGLHLVHMDRCEPEPEATLGKPPAIHPEHPMVRDAIATRTLTSVREERMVGRGATPLVCVPLVCVSGRLFGLVLIHELPFMAMREEHLALLAVLGAHVGDWLASQALPWSVIPREPAFARQCLVRRAQ